MRDILGGKGAGLAEMANLGLPVPPGFTISAKLCITYLEHGTFPDDLKALVREFKSISQAKCGLPFPEDPTVQLCGAIAAVFKSWRTRRAADYRRVHGIPDDLGTAVNVVAMVYGNMADDSGTGVAFTRDCRTGENVLNGDFLTNAQGEDVVSGARTPEPIAKMKRGALAKVYREPERIATKLERPFRDVQGIEFTFEHGRLFMLQTRRAQRTGLAAVRSAVEMVDDGLITADEAVQRLPPQDLDQLFHPMVDPRASVTVVAKGLPASPGAAMGEAVFDADEAEALAKRGRKVILIRPETSPEDFHGIVAAQAVLTARGGMTSHAAVVARGMGKTCVVGAQGIDVDPAGGRFRANGRVVKRGQTITVDGTA